MTPVDRRALGAWLGSRLAVVLLVLAAGSQLRAAPGFLGRWDRWDVGLFRKVAQYGYAGYPAHYPDRGIEAFFPGLPLVLAAVHVVLPSWTAAGLLISLVSGAVASVALSRLAALDGVDGPRTVLLLVVSPYAVFLAAGYSEALFLALAVPGWLAARRGSWAAAGLLVAGAAAVRVNGLFLAVALVVHYAVTVRRVRPDTAWLLAPFAVVAAYSAYLHALTGDWLRWSHAQAEGWGRHLTLPWVALRTTWQAARTSGLGPEYDWAFRAEVVAVVVGVVVTLVLLRRRSWGEATYVGLSVGALATSSYYLSVARGSLLWWPLWVLLARAASRRPWLSWLYLWVATPLMAVGVLAFTSGRWVD